MKTARATQLSLTLLLPLVICSCGRDISSVKKAILGHWVSESGKVNQYFGESTWIQNDGGREMEFSYTITETNEAMGTLKMTLKNAAGAGHEKEIRFSPDRKTMIHTFILGSARVDSKYNYVDTKERP